MELEALDTLCWGLALLLLFGIGYCLLAWWWESRQWARSPRQQLAEHARRLAVELEVVKGERHRLAQEVTARDVALANRDAALAELKRDNLALRRDLAELRGQLEVQAAGQGGEVADLRAELAEAHRALAMARVILRVVFRGQDPGPGPAPGGWRVVG